MKVKVIGVSGPSCSGKSTEAARLASRLDATVLRQDLYFVDPDYCSPDANFCDLRYLHVDEFVTAATHLASGVPTPVPTIDFSTFRRVGTVDLAPSPVLIIEGMTIFRIPAIAAMCQRRIYLTLEFEALAARKRERDVTERSKSAQIIAAQLEWMRHEYERDLVDLRGSVEFVDAGQDGSLLPILEDMIVAVEQW
jgi:uridine kinase